MNPTFRDTLNNYHPDTPAVAVDFETYYDDDCSVSSLSYWHYTHHPKFDAYMVSIHAPDFGISYVGPPGDFDWNRIDGMLWLAHNSPFDRAVFERLVEDGMTNARPLCWVNTADLAAYLFAPRSLKGAAKVLLNRTRSKKARSDMKGRVYAQLSTEDKQVMLDYAMDDAYDAYDLWEKYYKEWPLREQLLSLHTSECVRRGVHVDQAKINQSIDVLKKAVDAAERIIPWANEQVMIPSGKPSFFKDGRPKIHKPTSTKQLAEYARHCGIPLPSTTAVKSDEFQEWERTYGEKFPVIKALQTWRKANRLLRIFEQVKSRIRDDGRMEFQLCYFGAQSTGRWSGRPGGGVREGEDETGLNMQNLTKDPIYFTASGDLGTEDDHHYVIDLRSCFIALEGKKFNIADLSQIEPRCLAWIVGDEDFLEPVRKGQSPYEAHARASMGWTGGLLKKEDPDQYAFAKARVLSLGYAAGWQKFISMAAMYVGPVTFEKIFTQPVSQQQVQDFLDYLTAIDRNDLVTAYQGLDQRSQTIWVNSWIQVTDFRETNPKITKLWGHFQRHLKISGQRKEDYFVTLPSGRKLGYFEPRVYDQKATRYRGGPRSKVYGGLLTENLVQATARDVFGEGILRLERAGYPVVFHVHDEVICEIDKDVPSNDIVNLLAQSPDWMADLPVGAEATESQHYLK